MLEKFKLKPPWPAPALPQDSDNESAGVDAEREDAEQHILERRPTMALKSTTHLPCDPAAPLPATDPEEWKHVHTNRKQLEFPASRCTQTPVQKSSGTLLVCEKDPTTDNGNTLPGKQHAEDRKPDTNDDITQNTAPNYRTGKPQ